MNAVFIFRVVSVPAVVVLGLWIGLQFFNQWGATAATEETGGVAYGAHIGGFLTGMALALVLRMTGTKERPSRLSRGDGRAGQPTARGRHVSCEGLHDSRAWIRLDLRRVVPILTEVPLRR